MDDISSPQIVSVILVVRARSKFLLVRRSVKDPIFPGKWQNPGGKIRDGERIEKAVRRELEEETGIVPETYPIFLQSYSWEKAKEEPLRLGLIFLTKLKKDFSEYSVRINDEIEDYGWFTLKETEKLDLIGQDSSTGTFGQLLKAKRILKKLGGSRI